MYFIIGICTLNRPQDLDITLQSIINNTTLPNRIIIVDQSNNENRQLNKLVIEKNNALVPTDYHAVDFLGLTRGRNFIISKLQANDDILCFLDDDVTLDMNYIENISKVFIDDNVMGVGGRFINRRPLYQYFIHKLVFNSQWSIRDQYVEENMINYIPLLPEGIKTVQWLSGGNSAYRCQVFLKYKFDEKMIRYCTGEDLAFSHILHKDGLLLKYCSDAGLLHRVSPFERLPPTARVFMKLTYHRYLIAMFRDKEQINTLYKSFLRRYIRWNLASRSDIYEINKLAVSYSDSIDNLELGEVNKEINNILQKKI